MDSQDRDTKTKEVESIDSEEESSEMEEILEGETSLTPQSKEEEQREDPFAHLSLPPMGSDDEFDSLGEDSEEVPVKKRSKSKKISFQNFQLRM